MCVTVLIMICWDKNTECHGHCQIILEKSLEGRIPMLSNASWVGLAHLDDARDETKNPHSPAREEWGFPRS